MLIVILNLTRGVFTYTTEKYSIEKILSPGKLLEISHRLYHRGWSMSYTTRKDSTGSDVLDTITLRKP